MSARPPTKEQARKAWLDYRRADAQIQRLRQYKPTPGTNDRLKQERKRHERAFQIITSFFDGKPAPAEEKEIPLPF